LSLCLIFKQGVMPARHHPKGPGTYSRASTRRLREVSVHLDEGISVTEPASNSSAQCWEQYREAVPGCLACSRVASARELALLQLFLPVDEDREWYGARAPRDHGEEESSPVGRKVPLDVGPAWPA
jgi:hypothetical protein